MSKADSISKTLSRTFTKQKISDTGTSNDSVSGNGSSNRKNQNPPQLKTRENAKKAIPEMEADGSLLKRSARESQESDENKIFDSERSTQWFTRQQADYDRHARELDKQEGKNTKENSANATTGKSNQAKANKPRLDLSRLPSTTPEHLTPQKPLESGGEPRMQRLNRTETISEKVRRGLNLSPRTSLNTDSKQALTLGELAQSRWVMTATVKEDGEGFPLLDKLPPSLRRALAMEYQQFSTKKANEKIPVEEREAHLKEALAKKFLVLALRHQDSGFDQSKIGSLPAINRYLSQKFGIKISQELPSGQEAPSSPRSPRSPSSPRSRMRSSFSSSSAWSPRSPRSEDFRDLLVQDALHRSRNYQVNYSLDLRDLSGDPFAKTVINTEIESNKAGEKVTSGRRTDVGGIFQRDFENSVYQYEKEDGTIGDFESIDEFVDFIGDPAKAGLPKAVSTYACQSLGIIIKNLLFSRKDDKGNLLSPLHLFDGTPVNFSTSQKASYRFKKLEDGGVELSYEAIINTKEESKSGKASARLILSGDGLKNRVASVDNAEARITFRMTFDPKGNAQMDILKLEAKGWNQMNE